jgi:hypothetical protein
MVVRRSSTGPAPAASVVSASAWPVASSEPVWTVSAARRVYTDVELEEKTPTS